MLKYLLVFVGAFLCLLSPAEARHRHHYHHYHHRHHQRVAQPVCADLFCMFGTYQQQVSQQPVRYVGHSRWTATRPDVARQTLSYGSFEAVSRPARFIAGRLACALNVNAALAERGIRGTGSAAALSYLRWGRSAGGPVPGAVIVSPRRGGGHVAIVSRVENGTVYAWNTPGGRHGWQEIAYHRRVLDYRVPG